MKLSWLGARFRPQIWLVSESTANTSRARGIDYTAALATVPAYVAGIITDGYGYGQFGHGGFGQSSASYSWTSQPLYGGTWAWGVKPFDYAGNEGSSEMASVPVNAPPLPPAPFPDRTSLHYIYTRSTRQAELEWNLSPG